MGLTVLQLVQAACYGGGIQAPSSLFGATTRDALELLNIFYEVGRELRSSRPWPQLKKRFTVRLESQRERYHVPQDFYKALAGTHWDQSNRIQAQGPLSDAEWNYRNYGYVTVENRIAYRLLGTDNPNDTQGQFFVNPIPGEAVAGEEITFEYISRSWLNPPNWVGGGTVTSTASTYSNGNIYTHSSGTTCGTVAPSMAHGEGRDGGVLWLALTVAAWQASTAYNPGEYVTNGGNLYVCKSAGASDGSGGPTGTDEDTEVADSTVSWLYIPTSSWTAGTEYERDEHLKISSQYYRCVNRSAQSPTAAISGKVSPTWTTTTQSDGTITWTFYTGAYEAITSDSDLCKFDDELMIAGLKYRFKQLRGLEFRDDRAEYEKLKRAGVGRLNAGRKISMGGEGFMLSGLNPNIPDGGYG